MEATPLSSKPLADQILPRTLLPQSPTGDEQQLSLLQSVTYELIRSRRKTLSISVRGQQVIVRAPLQAPRDWIQSFVDEKTDWIQRHLQLEAQRRTERPVIAAGSDFPFLGENRRIQIQVGAPRRVELQQSTLNLQTNDPSSAVLQAMLFSWLRDRAQAYMVKRTQEVARELSVEHRLSAVTFRKTRSKWGHCRQDGSIQYNWLIMLAPLAIVDYLIVHETSHLCHMNHSKPFWSTVASLCPDYKHHRSWLREHGHRLWPMTV